MEQKEMKMNGSKKSMLVLFNLVDKFIFLKKLQLPFYLYF